MVYWELGQEFPHECAAVFISFIHAEIFSAFLAIEYSE